MHHEHIESTPNLDRQLCSQRYPLQWAIAHTAMGIAVDSVPRTLISLFDRRSRRSVPTMYRGATAVAKYGGPFRCRWYWSMFTIVVRISTKSRMLLDRSGDERRLVVQKRYAEYQS